MTTTFQIWLLISALSLVAALSNYEKPPSLPLVYHVSYVVSPSPGVIQYWSSTISWSGTADPMKMVKQAEECIIKNNAAKGWDKVCIMSMTKLEASP